MLEAVPWENPMYGISGGAAGNVAYGGTVNPPRNRKGGAGNPPPKGARASALPNERDELAGITRKGSHQSQKVINALILLNCDEGEFNEHRARGEAVAEILRISARKVDRVKKRFVEEGMEAALGGRQGRRPSYVRKADGEFEARLVALSCAEPPEGHSQWSLRLLADHVVELGHIDSVSHETVRRVLKKTQSSRGGASAG